nr:PREDICTED: probable G-protein coupled receptor 139 [Linepithema humile]
MDDKHNPELNVMELIKKYYLPIFLCLSLLGNSLSVCVLFCTKLRYKSSSIYLGALAMSDTGMLVITFIQWFVVMKIITVDYWLLVLLNGSIYLFSFLSVWIVVVFTVQRYIVVQWPLLCCSLCTVTRAKNIVIGLAGLAVLLSIPVFILLYIIYTNSDADEEEMFHWSKISYFNDTIINDTIITTYLPATIPSFIMLNISYTILYVDENLMYWWWILSIIDAIITCFLPATTIVIFNVLIVYNIRKQNRIRKDMISSFFASNKNTQSSDNEASHIEVTKMLVIISTLFICLNVPTYVVDLCDYYGICGTYCVIIEYIVELLWLANCGINVVLYCATGKNFRKELIRMFTKFRY